MFFNQCGVTLQLQNVIKTFEVEPWLALPSSIMGQHYTLYLQVRDSLCRRYRDNDLQKMGLQQNATEVRDGSKICFLKNYIFKKIQVQKWSKNSSIRVSKFCRFSQLYISTLLLQNSVCATDAYCKIFRLNLCL